MIVKKTDNGLVMDFPALPYHKIEWSPQLQALNLKQPCVIAPYWCDRLGTPSIKARQGGRRQGELLCEIKGNRVLLYGSCHLYLKGTIYLP
ncbi:protein of unknown function [Legionella fallonii LLAP-10]|uniref:Uncharacterized protein n=1 Tax=Legionella fallonii LLAP-10 TaxID=1212491 RepID=A0A098G525_9GAMM|nr:protein of unknown function [Legionella fallonii LLAP-10]